MKFKEAAEHSICTGLPMYRKSLEFAKGKTKIAPNKEWERFTVLDERETTSGNPRRVKLWNPTAEDLIADDWEVVTE